MVFWLFCLFSTQARAQESCGQIFTNPGGIAIGYLPGNHFSDTLNAGAGQKLMIDFSLVSFGENDTLTLFDPYFYNETVIVITNQSEFPVFESVSPFAVWVFNASGSEGGDGWEAEVSCMNALYFEIQSDTICAGFEGFLPWQVSIPFTSELLVVAELSDNPDFDGDLIALGENQIASDSFYLQTGAMLSEGLYYLRLSAEDSAYSFLQNIQTIYLKALPAIPVITGDNQFCVGDTISLQVDTEIRTNYAWLLNGLALNQAFEEVLDVSEAGVYTASAGNVCGTVLSEPFEVLALTIPDVPLLMANGNFVCPGEGLEISLQNPSLSELDLWFNQSAQIAQNTSSVSVAEAAAIFVIRQNSCGTATSDTFLITAPGIPPQVVIETPSGTEFCEGATLPLQANIPTGFDYQWFVNNSPIDAPDTWFTNQQGTYSLTLSNVCGTTPAANNAAIFMLPVPQPASLLAAGPTELCEGESVLLIAAVQPGESFQWYLNDSPLQNNSLQLSATQSGSYFLSTSTICGSVNSQNVIAITVNPLPEVPLIFEIGNPALCNGSAVDLFVTPQAGVSFSWRRNNATFSSGTNSISTTEAGVYTVLATNACGTVNGASSVSVTSGNPPVSATIAANGPTTFCEGLQVSLQTTPQNGVVYTWLLNGSPLTSSGFSFAAQQSGIYSLQLSNACDTIQATNTIPIQVNPLPPSYQITPVEEQNLCLGESVVLSIPTTPGVSYQWRLNGSTVGQNSAQLNTSAEGLYTLVLANNCGSTPAQNSVLVNVDSLLPNPPQIIAQPGTALCPGGYVLLNAPPVPFQQYTWLLNGEPVLGAVNPVLQATEWGLYSVQASNACGVSEVSPTIELGPGDPPQDFEIYTSEGLEVCSNDSLALTAQVNFGVGIRWFYNNQLFADGPAQIYVSEAGTYTAEAYNGCGEASGLNSLTISVLEAPETPVIFLNGNVLSTTASGNLQWYNSALELLVGQTINEFLPPAMNASYYVSSTNEFGCTSFSQPFNYIINSLLSLQESELQPYPNPATGQVNFFAIAGEPIVLRDAEGRILHIFENRLNKNQLVQLDVSFWASGVYLLSQGNLTNRLLIVNP